MSTSAQVLFEFIDTRLDERAKHLRNQLFSTYRDLPWTDDQRKRVQPLIRQELEAVILSVLKLFNNVGCVLPDDVSGWTITTLDDGTDISINNDDYADMWRDYLAQKTTNTAE